VNSKIEKYIQRTQLTSKTCQFCPTGPKAHFLLFHIGVVFVRSMASDGLKALILVGGEQMLCAKTS
jgi:hypothetical protein